MYPKTANWVHITPHMYTKTAFRTHIVRICTRKWKFVYILFEPVLYYDGKKGGNLWRFILYKVKLYRINIESFYLAKF